MIEEAVAHCSAHGWMRTINKLGDITSAPHYSEPGYKLEEGKTCILFGNWNRNRYHRLGEASTPDQIAEDDFYEEFCKQLETVAELEWHDEWTTCSDCGGAIRTSPDGHGWQKSYVELGGDQICRRCAPAQADEIIEELAGNPRLCLSANLGIKLAEHGYVRLAQDFERGLHHHQAADPQLIGKTLLARGIDRYVFAMEAVGQFDTRFAVWVPVEQATLLPAELTTAETDSPISPAQHMEAGLRSVALVPAGPGVHCVTINTDTGAVHNRVVTPEDFIAGRA
jgi:hypothetical protein